MNFVPRAVSPLNRVFFLVLAVCGALFLSTYCSFPAFASTEAAFPEISEADKDLPDKVIAEAKRLIEAVMARDVDAALKNGPDEMQALRPKFERVFAKLKGSQPKAIRGVQAQTLYELIKGKLQVHYYFLGYEITTEAGYIIAFFRLQKTEPCCQLSWLGASSVDKPYHELTAEDMRQ